MDTSAGGVERQESSHARCVTSAPSIPSEVDHTCYPRWWAMGAHKGYFVRLRGDRYQAAYRVAGRYKLKTFSSEVAAIAWGSSKAAQVQAQLEPSVSVPITTPGAWHQEAERLLRSYDLLANDHTMPPAMQWMATRIAAELRHLLTLDRIPTPSGCD
jgi:hypothetical protein